MVLVIFAGPDENRAIAFSGNPAITRPLLAGRWTRSNPNRRAPPGSPPFSSADR
jgi:hypothetical protein